MAQLVEQRAAMREVVSSTWPGDLFSYLIHSCWGLFGTCFIMSDKLIGKECQFRDLTEA